MSSCSGGYSKTGYKLGIPLGWGIQKPRPVKRTNPIDSIKNPKHRQSDGVVFNVFIGPPKK